MELKEERIVVAGKEITLKGVDQILKEVENLNMEDEQSQREIMKRVRMYNYIPPELEEEVLSVLWGLYLKRKGAGRGGT
ncbi:MAG: hypothetical protein J7K08_07385 [Thermoplasmata archaeon]|nr:hypothetical protein [Thermoplasmata archaeon]OYT49207.1 MAG: hypothetical protein B6U83_02770 [Thermoplasmatales archaeon ex4484_36]RLF71904.1 MAG: hypothetical protein DRN40_01495 [Thermoplasmata archaeon]RLF72320.1 MAG: hypothetical protein DRN35_00825 [Thermoplasmata archaeon]RLF76293.1 MAG: hypothetical protein DRN42_01310 [Thermoplasmata archaeon]